jgi:hypothetical protein
MFDKLASFNRVANTITFRVVTRVPTIYDHHTLTTRVVPVSQKALFALQWVEREWSDSFKPKPLSPKYLIPFREPV